MKAYSDLLIEASHLTKSSSNIETFSNVPISKYIITKNESLITHRKPGKYITLLPNNNCCENDIKLALKHSFIELFDYLNISLNKLIIIGLGNNDYIVDSLGEEVVKKIKVKQNKLCAFSPKTDYKTGISSSNIIKAVVDNLSPSAVIIIDSIVTKSKDKLCNCFQLTSAGIAPGGGVSNRQQFIDSKFLGKPLICIGFPAIISNKNNYLFTPFNIEDYIKKSSSIIASTINDLF